MKKLLIPVFLLIAASASAQNAPVSNKATEKALPSAQRPEVVRPVNAPAQAVPTQSKAATTGLTPTPVSQEQKKATVAPKAKPTSKK